MFSHPYLTLNQAHTGGGDTPYILHYYILLDQWLVQGKLVTVGLMYVTVTLTSFGVMREGVQLVE